MPPFIGKVFSGEVEEVRITFSDVINGIASLFVIFVELYALRMDVVNTLLLNMHKIMVNNNIIYIVSIGIFLFIISWPFGIMLNALSFMIYEPIAVKLRFILYRYTPVRSYICVHHPYYCTIIGDPSDDNFNEEAFNEVLSKCMVLHHFFKNMNMFPFTTKMSGRMIGSYILFRTLSMIMLISGVILGLFMSYIMNGYINWPYFVTNCIMSFIMAALSSLTDLYASAHVLRGLYGLHIIITQTQQQISADENLSLETLISSLSRALHSEGRVLPPERGE